MSDVAADLKGFTPAAPNRDALLFAAGRASAPRRTLWKWLVVGLMVSNAVTLAVLLWPKPEVPVPVVPDPPDVVDPIPVRPDPHSYLALTMGLEPPVADAGQRPAPPDAPLTPRAFNDPRFR
jgi:hypothetical protein